MSTTTTTTFVSQKTVSSPFIASSPQRKTMSITQTYFLAHKARAKLSSEAARPDHNLRLLVGHANLLDTLMLELADAEREQESWFNQSVRGASTQQTQKADRRVQWADTVVEDPEEDWQAEDADDDSDASSDASDDYSDSDEEESDSESSLEEDEDVEMADAVPLRRVASHSKPMAEEVEVDSESDDEVEEDDEEDYAHLTLTRSPSHSASQPPLSPPELMNSADSDASSDDESDMPPSPPVVTIKTFAKKGSKTTAASPQQEDEAFVDNTNNYYLPPRNPARLISAISVY